MLCAFCLVRANLFVSGLVIYVFCVFSLIVVNLVASTSAVDCLERFVFEVTCYESSRMLNSARTLTLGFGVL